MSSLPTSPRLMERTITYSPIGLSMVDDLTSGPPIGRVSVELQQVDTKPPGWRKTGIAAVIGLGGVISYPGLGRSTRPAETPIRRYRVVLTAEYYRPLYPVGKGGFEFDVHPFNNSNPPAQLPAGLTQAILIPSAHYPFSSDLVVLRGKTVDHLGKPIADAQVSYKLQQTALTDERGEFALPLRQVAETSFSLDATDALKRHGSLRVRLPDDLSRGLTITLS